MLSLWMTASMGQTCIGSCGSYNRDFQCSCLHEGGEATGIIGIFYLRNFNILVIFRFDSVGGSASVNHFGGPCDLYRLN